MSEYDISYWMCTRELVGGAHYKESIVDAIKNKINYRCKYKNFYITLKGFEG
jgi:hypothetical protein